MSNMSYCRFENTVHDLKDCQAALEDLFNGSTDEDGDASLSERELAKAKELVETCYDILMIVAESTGGSIERNALDEINTRDLDKAIDDAQQTAKEDDDARAEEEERRDAIEEGKEGGK